MQYCSMQYNDLDKLNITKPTRKFDKVFFHSYPDNCVPNIRFKRNETSLSRMDDCLASGRHLTVFNSQSLLQVGGRWSEYKQTLDMPFQVQDLVWLTDWCPWSSCLLIYLFRACWQGSPTMVCAPWTWLIRRVSGARCGGSSPPWPPSLMTTR